MADPRITQIIEALERIKRPRYGLELGATDEERADYWHGLAEEYRRIAANALQAATQAQQPAQQTDDKIRWAEGIARRVLGDVDAVSLATGTRIAIEAMNDLAAAPQQPAQQAVRMPLTRERMEAIFHQHMPRTRYTACFDGFGRAIEAAHGIALPPAAKEGEKKQ
jgi:hypothetical protein